MVISFGSNNVNCSFALSGFIYFVVRITPRTWVKIKQNQPHYPTSQPNITLVQ